MSATTPYRVHVWPRLRRPGELLLRDWLAIAIGSHIWAWRPLSGRELAHELAHVRQWRQHGLLFPLHYLLASIRAAREGSSWYHANQFEREARAAELASG